jgi:disease resistance protein RPS2
MRDVTGTAMRGKTIVELWKHNINELQRLVPCTGGVEDKLYKPLKWSYNSLEGKNIKPCFLYCSLFPKDFSIEISELVQY